jgi:enterochelin esterase family protein
MKQWPDFTERLTVLWSGAGVDEKQFVDRQNGFQKMIEEAGIEAQFYLSDGTAHEWQTWRRCLHEFAPLLFKQNK